MQKDKPKNKEKNAFELIQIAREYAFLGMYQEAINKFELGMDMIQNVHMKGKSDPQLFEAFNSLLKNIRFERDSCDSLRKIVYEGRIDGAPPRKASSQNRANSRNSGSNGQKYPYNKKPFNMERENQDSRRRGGNHAPPSNVEWMGDGKKGHPKSNDRQIGRDPDEWSPPPAKNPKNRKGGRSQNAGKSRNYEKPWKVRNGSKDAKGKKKGGSKEDESAFLLNVYPDGTGPDAELIKMLERDMLDKNPNVTFDDIASLNDAKQVLKETVLLPLMMPNYFQGIRDPRKGVLLFGPPGTGKTMLAKAVATFGKTTFFNVHASTLASKWKGESEKLVRLLFEMARFYAPSTIFIDEIDSIASARDGKGDESSRKVKSELLVQIDGASKADEGEESDGKPKNIIVLGATNLPWDLDLAIIRRLDKRIYIPLPDAHARGELFKIMMKKENVDPNINWEPIVEKTHMFSGDDIKNLCRDAAMAPLRRMMLEGSHKNIEEIKNMEDDLKNTPIAEKDFLYALRTVKPSNTDEKLGEYAKWMKDYGSC